MFELNLEDDKNSRYNVTVGEMCKCISDVFNSGKCKTKLSPDDIFHLDDSLAIKGLHWLPYLYDVAVQGPDMLTGLLVSDEFYAKLFCKKLDSIEKQGVL